MSKVILQLSKDQTNVNGGTYVRDLVECQNCAINDPFCDIHDIYGVEWCSLGKLAEGKTYNCD